MEFSEHLQKYLSKPTIDKLIDSFSEPSKKCFVYNPKKINREYIEANFKSAVKNENHPFCYNYDSTVDDLGKSIEQYVGAFYIMDPSAVLISKYLQIKDGEDMLDLCAAPGGKSISCSLCNEHGFIISNDYSFPRAQVLSSNVERFGLANIVVTSYKPSYFLLKKYKFDKIILDAPCSGSGMFRKENKMKDDWTYEKVLKLVPIQKELIMLAYSLLKEGGLMSYSTCSYSYEEDEDIVKYLLNNTDAELVDIEENTNYLRSDLSQTIHLLTSEYEGEGHYIAIIKKPGIKEITYYKNKDKTILDNLSLIQKGNTFFGIKKYHPLINELSFLRAGVKICETENKIIKLDHALASYLEKFTFVYYMNLEECKKYLHGDIISCSSELKGYVLMKFNNMSVGFGKANNGQIKNHYPKGLRLNLIKN